MADNNSCPSCGAMRPAGAPAGLCPQCLLRLGLGADLSNGSPAGAAHTVALRMAAALTVLEEAVGPVPRVLLRDTEAGPETPIVRPGSDEVPDDANISGRYQFLGEIARGGMGAVLKGRDTDLGRDLAVKVLLEAHRDHPDLVRRFVEEAQIGGQLQHPGVVPVYELGTFEDLRPYFTMKLVKGRTLAALLKDRPSPAHDLPRFLAVFEAVCQTMAYAHSRGVIHRDLKPSNVMVGSFGEVQVVDWGLAKVLPAGGVADERPEVPAELSVIHTVRSGSDADASRPGSVLGTPAYMAPEQARGEVESVDERADVFGLGSILCEILTGQPAYAGRSYAEVLRRSARGDLSDASTRLDACGTDAELIGLVRDCLAAERDDRPRDAGAVAGRVTAYREGVQRKLRAAELAHAEAEARAAEERKRRRLTVALAASVLGSVLLAGGGWAWMARQRAERAATISRQVNEALVEANQSRGQYNLAVAIASAKRAEALLQTESGGDVELRGRVHALLADLVAKEKDRRMLERLDEIRTMVGASLDRPEVNASYAAAFREYGIDIDALPPAEAGKRIAARPDAIALAASLDHWTFIRRNMNRPDRAGALRLAAAAAADPDPWRNRLRDECNRNGRDPEPFRRLAADLDPASQTSLAISRLSGELSLRGDTEKATSLTRDLQRHRPDDFWVNCNLASFLLSLSPPQTDEALRFLTAALALRPRSAFAHHLLGTVFRYKGASDEAIGEYREALRINPDIPQARHALGSVLASRGELDAAIAEFRELLRLMPDSAGYYDSVMDIFRAKGAFAEMVPIIRRVSERYPDNTRLRSQLALVLLSSGDLEGYRRACAEAIERFGASTDPYAYRVAHACSLAPDPSPFAPVVLKLAEAGVNRFPEAGWTRYDLGLVHYRAGHYEQAIERLDESMRVSPDWNASSLALPILAMAHHRLGHAEEARKWLGRAHDTPGDAALGIPPGQKFSPETHWWDRAEFEFLLREADALVSRPSSNPDPP